MNIAENLVRSAGEHAERIAIRLDDVELTYQALEGATRHVAGLLGQHGIEPGDRVGIMLPNVPHFALLYYGALRAGAIVVPMNPLLKEREVAYYLGNSGAKLIFAWETFRAEAEAGAKLADTESIVVDPEEFTSLIAAAPPVEGVVERADDDTAVILYTSGTTGQPKGAELTNANLSRNVEISADELIGITAGDVVFGGLPLFHVFGQTCGLNAAVYAGATLTLLPKFDPASALEILARDRVTVFEGVPTMYVALLHSPDRANYDVSALRVSVSGGAAMPVEVMSGFEQEFGCVVLEGYGLSETSPAASFNMRDKRRPGSIGTPIPGVEFKIVDSEGVEVPPGEIGEIVIRGHNVMKGYWDKPEETAKAIRDIGGAPAGEGVAGRGWFHTGDMGRQDDAGFYYIVDRKKEMIIRGGYNVYPREIEEVLYEHPAVAEAAVVGIPHTELGEEIAAVVALKPDATATAKELRAFVKDKVAAYKYPRTVQIVDALPKGPTGKILKREIKLAQAQR